MLLRAAILLLEDVAFLHVGQVLHGDVTIHARHDAAAFLLNFSREGLDLRGRVFKQIIKTLAEKCVVDGHERKHRRMVEGSPKLMLQLLYSRHDA